jgi:hypothetical protein
MYRNKTLNMKNHALLLIASLAVLTSSVSAASNQSQTETVVLPTYVVTAPRYLPAEQQINASLKEFTKQALTPMIITPDTNSLKAQSAQHQQLAEASRATHAARIAKS